MSNSIKVLIWLEFNDLFITWSGFLGGMLENKFLNITVFFNNIGEKVRGWFDVQVFWYMIQLA